MLVRLKEAAARLGLTSCVMIFEPHPREAGANGGADRQPARLARASDRVIQRLAPEVARAMVAEVVSDIAERLVKEEIERIRKGPNA